MCIICKERQEVLWHSTSDSDLVRRAADEDAPRSKVVAACSEMWRPQGSACSAGGWLGDAEVKNRMAQNLCSALAFHFGF